MTIPDFLIVGAPKCGTTSLFYWLEQHPGTSMSRTSETGYFLGEGRASTLEEYRSFYFPEAKSGQLTGEATTLYLASAMAEQQIHHANPEAKIVVCVRPHAAAAVSHYHHWLVERRLPGIERTLRRAMEGDPTYAFLLKPYRYVDHLTRYVRRFTRERVHVVDFRAICTRPSEVLRETVGFLGLDRVGCEAVRLERHNSARAVRFRAGRQVFRGVVGLRAVRRLGRGLPVGWRDRIRRTSNRVFIKPAAYA
ncbi:MAG: sulfotransferase domain-containing protein, partial [Planctomycetota bacterium]